MEFDKKIVLLNDIYPDHDAAVRPYMSAAICKKGCAFCCTHYGSLDITTLEGFIIYERIDRYKRPLKIRIKKAISQNRRRKENGKTARCPFLNRENGCTIYDVRPFSCRQLYSLKDCREYGPTLHRRAVEINARTIERLQHLDDTGYSGHISYIISMLDDRDFRTLYTGGGFDPSQIMSFGKSHGIVINRMMDR